MAAQYAQQAPIKKEVKFCDYVKNPTGYQGFITNFSGSIESQQEYEQHSPGSIILLVKPNFELSGALTTEPIHILVEGQNQYKDSCLDYVGNQTVLDFECAIMQKPQGIHWFMLIKTTWGRTDYISGNNLREKAKQQAQTPVQPVGANTEVQFINYVANPSEYVGGTVHFQGQVGNSQDYNYEGVTGKVFAILLNTQKSGAMTIEPIQILVESGNKYINEMNMQKGSQTILKFVCEIFEKPQNSHWFKLIKTEYPDTDYNSDYPSAQPQGPPQGTSQKPIQPVFNPFQQHKQPQPVAPVQQRPGPMPVPKPGPMPVPKTGQTPVPKPGPIKCPTIRQPQPPQPDVELEKRTFCHLTNKVMTYPVRADDGWYYNAVELNQYLKTHNNILPTGTQQRNLALRIDENVQNQIINTLQDYART